MSALRGQCSEQELPVATLKKHVLWPQNLKDVNTSHIKLL